MSIVEDEERVLEESDGSPCAKNISEVPLEVRKPHKPVTTDPAEGPTVENSLNSEEPLFTENEGKDETQNTLRILITTDTHLGYKCDDPIRGNDSFETFEEILKIGRRENVDFILHGGDFFDDNKPSRTTMYRALCLLRKYCFGDGDVTFDVLNEEVEASEANMSQHGSQIKGSMLNRDAEQSGDEVEMPQEQSADACKGVEGVFRFGLNYLDSNVNVCMPIFVMHGNHDDPGDRSHLSPLDILEAAHLINYFGRVENVDDIQIRPILFSKGTTKVAVYGMGWIRDERLHRAYRSGKVRYLVPKEGSLDEWFNLVVVHQNMYHGTQGALPSKQCVLDQMLPDFTDIVIWGHEHDCHPQLRESACGRLQILQAGSSIATSLVPGEALPKHVFVLEIRGGDYRLLPIQLTTIRPLLIKECSLAELCAESASSAQSGSAPSRPRSQSEDAEAEMDGQVWRVLTEVVDVLLQRFEQERGVVAVEIKSQKTSKLPASKRRRAYQLFCNYSGGTQDAAPFKASLSSGQAAHKNLKAKLAKHRLPLVRFIGRVANPDSLITFYKKRSIATSGSAKEEQLPDLEVEEFQEGDVAGIHDIIFHYVKETNGLSVLPEPELNEAVQDFAVKSDPQAITCFIDDCVTSAKTHARKQLSHVLDVGEGQEPSLEETRELIKTLTQSARLRRLDGSEEEAGEGPSEDASSLKDTADVLLKKVQAEACLEWTEEPQGTLRQTQSLTALVDSEEDEDKSLFSEDQTSSLQRVTPARSVSLTETASCVEEEEFELQNPKSLPKRSKTTSRRGRGCGARTEASKKSHLSKEDSVVSGCFSASQKFNSPAPLKPTATQRKTERQMDIRSLLTQMSARRRLASTVQAEPPSGDCVEVDLTNSSNLQRDSAGEQEEEQHQEEVEEECAEETQPSATKRRCPSLSATKPSTRVAPIKPPLPLRPMDLPWNSSLPASEREPSQLSQTEWNSSLSKRRKAGRAGDANPLAHAISQVGSAREVTSSRRRLNPGNSLTSQEESFSTETDSKQIQWERS